MSHQLKMKKQPIADQLFKEGLLTTRRTQKIQEILDEAALWLIQEHERLATLERANSKERALAERLRKKFGLMDARVVSGGETRTATEYAALVRQYGIVAADYFDELVSLAADRREELHVAVGGGQTILDMVGSLLERKRSNVTYYAAGLVGRGSLTREAHINPSTNATVAWARSGRILGQLNYVTVSPYNIDSTAFQDTNSREKQKYGRELIRAAISALKDSVQIKSMLEALTVETINIAIAGLGIVQPEGIDATYGPAHSERLALTGLLRPLGIDPKLLMEEGAVGDICYSMFDAEGNGNKNWEFFLTAGHGSKYPGVDFYRQLVKKKCPVIVSAGQRKESAILAALRPEEKLFNVLITDAYTAERLLKA
jgi:DNA-binding transcriptional regulator LsrR (DeoR family)